MTNSIYCGLLWREFRPMVRENSVYWTTAKVVGTLSALALYLCWDVSKDPQSVYWHMDMIHFLLMLGVFGGLPVVAASAMQHDLERGTLESLRATPIAPYTIVLSKGVVLLGWTAVVGITLLPVVTKFHTEFGLSRSYLAESTVLLACAACCAVSIGLYVASAVRSPLLVPFVLYGSILAVLFVPVGLFAMLSVWLDVKLTLGSATVSPLWALFHPWQGWPNTTAAYSYLAYLLVVSLVFLWLAQFALRHRSVQASYAEAGGEAPAWQPIPDGANPIGAAYYRTNPFSTLTMQRTLLAVGFFGGLCFRVSLSGDWTLFRLGHMLDVDYVLFAFTLVGVVIASQQRASSDENREQLRVSLLDPKTVDKGSAWGGARLCRPLLIGLIGGRCISYIIYVFLFSKGILDPSPLLFVIHTLTYVAVGMFFVVSATQDGQIRTNGHSGYITRVTGVVMGCFIVEMYFGLSGFRGSESWQIGLGRLGLYLAISGIHYYLYIGKRGCDEAWKPRTNWMGKELDD